MNKIVASKPVLFFAGIGAFAVGVAETLFNGTALAAGPAALDQGINETTGNTGLATNLPQIFGTIANVLIYLVGAIAVIMLIIGGLRYVVSNGDSKNVEAAKNTILYAVIGIIIAILSLAIVRFVVDRVGGGQ